MKSTIDVNEHRKARQPINPLFLNRWSPRAMSGEELSKKELMVLFEAAWENLALQGSQQNLVVHGMQGFDYGKAKQLLKVPDNYQVEAMIAIGKPGKKEDLPKQLQARELPSRCKKIAEISFEGQFPQQ